MMRHPSFLSALGLLACLGSSGVARAERLRFDCGNPTVPLYRSVVGVGATEDAAFKDAELKIGLSYCAKGTDCTPVRATFKRYGIDDSDGRRVCARMVALTDELLRAKEGVSSIKPLLQQLRISAQELSTSLMIRRLSPRVVLASIRDLGSYYGDRVERFRAWIEAALTETPGIDVQTPRYDVRGQLIVPTGQSRLSANVVERVEGGIAVVEIQLHVDLPTGQRLALPSASGARVATIEAGAIPPTPVAGARKDSLEDPSLTLDLDVGDDGLICEGDVTQLTLTVPQRMHVRVFNLFGDDGLLLFPNRRHPSDLVEMPIPLFGDKGARFVMAPGADHDRYIVIASETVEGLGPWAGLTDYCRLRPEHIKALIDTPASAFGAAKVSDRSFRITRDGCPNALTDAERQATFSAFPEYCPL